MASYDRLKTGLPVIDFQEHRVPPRRGVSRTQRVPIKYAPFIDRNKYNPAKLGRLMLLDTSGTITPDELDAFTSEVKHIIEQEEP